MGLIAKQAQQSMLIISPDTMYGTPVAQNIRRMTIENKHPILDCFRIGFSWHFHSK
jgi:hypothetical protein